MTILVALLGGLPPAAMAQKPILHQSLLWTRALLRAELNPHWQTQVEVENRRFFEPTGGPHQFIVHAQLVRHGARHLDWAQGFTFTELQAQRPNGNNGAPSQELRSWQTLAWPLAKTGTWKLQQRLRLEERFFLPNRRAETPTNYRFELRGRHLLMWRGPLAAKWDGFLADEVLLHAGKGISHVFDQHRLMAGVEWKMTPQQSLEGSYTWWWQQRASHALVYDRDIFRLTWIYRLNPGAHRPTPLPQPVGQ